MMQDKRKITKLLTMLSTLLLLTGCKRSSIGVIGGADGPTAIFTTAQINPSWLWPTLLLVVLVVIGFILWRRRRK